MFDAVSAKKAVIKELNTKNAGTELVESWKQAARDERANIFGARQRVMNELSQGKLVLAPPQEAADNKTVEQHYNACMHEIRENANTQVVEQWKCEAIENRRLIFAARHEMMSELAGKTVESLKKAELSPVEQHKACMTELATKAEPVPAWKQAQRDTITSTLHHKKQVVHEISTTARQLKSNTTLAAKHSRVMSELRTVEVEGWKQAIRSSHAQPMLAKHATLVELVESSVALKPVCSARAATISALNKQTIPAWKERIARVHREQVERRRAVICDIAERKFSLKKVANRRELLVEIRAAYNIPESTSFVEGWRQVGRDARAAAQEAKRNCMVSLEQEKVVLKSSSASNSHSQLHKACMQQIRGEMLESWKERVQAVRKNAIEGKRALCQEILAGKITLASSKSVQSKKLAVMAELRAESNSPVEAWKEAERNQRALQLGAKQLMHIEFGKKKSALKQTESIESCKLAVMQAIRCKQAQHIPAWQEAERAERANVQNARNAVMCQVRGEHKLEPTQTMQEIKRAVLSDIRRHQQPLEAWREAERTAQAGIYDNKRALVLAISNGVSSLENKRSQADLKDALLREIRAVGKSSVVPAWKEAKMQLRTQVLKNKVQLNAQICALTLKN